MRLAFLPRRLSLRGAAAIVVVLASLGGLWLWLRDSPVVAIDRVTITGAAGPDAPAIRTALMTAVRGMTTLDIDMGRLRSALSPFPEVKSLNVSTQLPHGLLIRVAEQLAVAKVTFEGRSEEVAADGTLLHAQSGAALPSVALAVPPGGPRVTEPAALAEIEAAAAAPWQLLGKISGLSEVSGRGLVAQLRSGPAVYLGDESRLVAKWLAASAVLASSGSAGASYIDVTDPERPAAGATQSGSSSSATASIAGSSGSGTSGTAGQSGNPQPGTQG